MDLTFRVFKCHLIRNQTSIQKVLGQSHESVLESASFLCGIIREKEDSMLEELRFMDDDTLLQLREERLVRALIFDVFLIDVF